MGVQVVCESAGVLRRHAHSAAVCAAEIAVLGRSFDRDSVGRG
jgi:hypothetical protein